MITQQHIAERIRMLREIRGESQLAISERVGFSRGKWSSIEQSLHALTWKDIQDVCGALEFDPGKLTGTLEAFARHLEGFAFDVLEKKEAI